MKNKIIIMILTSLLLSTCTVIEPVDTAGIPDTPSSKEIRWEEAKELILSGEVVEVVQFHDLKVILMLADGSELTTVEPELDDIFEVIEQCGEKCSDTIIATE